jgi:hypothetical protein
MPPAPLPALGFGGAISVQILPKLLAAHLVFAQNFVNSWLIVKPLSVKIYA